MNDTHDVIPVRGESAETPTVPLPRETVQQLLGLLRGMIEARRVAARQGIYDPQSDMLLTFRLLEEELAAALAGGAAHA
jgi:hypothetical protein